MFLVEFFSHKVLYEYTRIELGWPERIIGILFWPVCLCVFLYNFLKEFFK